MNAMKAKNSIAQLFFVQGNNKKMMHRKNVPFVSRLQ